MIEFFAILFAATLGSFANVLLHRLPIMILANDHEHDAKIDLMQPASHCPKCNTPLKWWHNIPLLSFVFLRRRCGMCGGLIEWRYFWVELGSVGLAVFCMWYWGLNFTALAYFLFLYVLWVLAWIDALHFLLPDVLTLGLLWLGLLYQAIAVPSQLIDSVFAAAFGYLLLFAAYGVYLWLTHKQGMGFGDMKLMAAIGAWLGLTAVANVLILACLSALFFMLFLYFKKNRNPQRMLPFGPFLAIGAAVFLIFRFDIGMWLTQL